VNGTAYQYTDNRNTENNRIWKTFAWQGYLDNVVILSITVVGVLICGQLCYRYLEKPLLNLSRRFSF